MTTDLAALQKQMQEIIDKGIEKGPAAPPDPADASEASILAVTNFSQAESGRLDLNANQVLATWPVIKDWILWMIDGAARIVTWPTRVVVGELIEQLRNLWDYVAKKYEQVVEFIKRCRQEVLVPGKALRDAMRWLVVRKHMTNYCNSIDPNMVNRELRKRHGIGWRGEASDVYRVAQSEQFAAGTTAMAIALRSSTGMNIYANGVARVVASFASETYAVLVKIGKLVISPVWILFDLSNIRAGVANVINAVTAVFEQLAAAMAYFTAAYLSSTIGLEYAGAALISVRNETLHLPYGKWPDPWEDTRFPTRDPNGSVAPHNESLRW